MKTNIFGKLKTVMSKAKFKIIQHSPEILVVAGIVGVVTSAVMACRATTKVKTITNEKTEKIKEIRSSFEEKKLNEKEMSKELIRTYFTTGLKLVRNYAPSVILGSLSLTSIISSNRILRKRMTTIAAAYATIDNSFKNYRKNVVERYGIEVDRELKYGIKTQKIIETTIDPETGKEIKTKKEANVVTLDNRGCSGYARFFDDGCTGWTKDSEYNLMFLRSQEQFANDKLKVQGYLFLNDVYDSLGIPRSKAGQSVGWIYDPNNKNHIGDNFVDFNIYDAYSPANRDFVNGYERVIILDFNVDGVILDRAIDLKIMSL